jgi:hypothetical protein
MRSLLEPDISTAMSSNPQAEFAMTSATEEREGKCSTAAFPKMFMFRGFVITVFSCYNVTPLPMNCCSTYLFATVYKRLARNSKMAARGRKQKVCLL